MPDKPRVSMSLEDKAELEEPIENIMSKGHGEVVVTVKIADHKIVNIKFGAQYELRKDK